MKAIYFQPLFDEQKCSYRFSYYLSKAMESKGIALERPDYRGMGDSDESFSSVTLERIREDVDKLISSQTDVLIGLRFGASMIGDFLSRNLPTCHQIILFEPIIDGQHYVQYLLRKQRLKDRLSELPAGFNPDEHYVNIEGYKTRKQFIDQINSFTFKSVEGVRGHRIRILTTRNRLSGTEGDFLLLLKKNNQVDTVSVQFPDIWERIPVLDYSPLIEPIIGWCHER